MELKKSEFIAADDFNFHVKDGKKTANVDGAKEFKIKKGENIPEICVPNLIRYNRDFIENLPMKDSIPQLTKEQEKKYGISFVKAPIKPFKEVVNKIYGKYTMESLKQKVAELKSEKFKNWCEEEFGEEKIDRRKSPDNLIVQILAWQDKEKQI